jgi:hypothetical protein
MAAMLRTKGVKGPGLLVMVGFMELVVVAVVQVLLVLLVVQLLVVMAVLALHQALLVHL